MTKLTRLLATTLLLALAAPWASALEMGDLAARSRLGQPFVGEIPLRGELYSQLGADCFRLVKPIDDAGLPDLQGIRFSYVTNARGAVLRLTGSEKVLDPALQVSVFIGCGMNLQRDYVLFMDLPGTLPGDAESAAPAVGAAPVSSKPRAQAPSPTRKAAAPAAAKPASRATQALAPVARPAAEIAVPVEKPAVPAAAIVPPLPEPETTAPAPKDDAPAAVPATQPTAPASPSDPWITAGLILLISLLLLGIWLQHRRNIREAALEEGYPHGEHPAAQDAFRGLAAAKAAVQPTPAPAAPPKPAPAATRLAPDDEMPILPASLKGEYMMDLTDVMLSFGETQRALSALNEFVHEHPDEAVAPWLRLLDLLRVHGKREEFDSLALKLHQVFNIKIPQWEPAQAAAEQAEPKAESPEPSLEDFVHVRQRLQDTWGQEECMKYLDILMRDNRAGQRKGFPVEVVEELILLRDVLSVRLNKA